MHLEARDTRFFHHNVRIGKNGKPFVLTKFRTMKKDSYRKTMFTKEIAEKKIFEGENLDDPRLTTIGRILKKTKLDELPQIYDLIKGNLIPVGVRPLPRTFYQILPDDIKKAYNEMGPGLIGIQYTVGKKFSSREEFFDEIRKFYEMWKKNRIKTYLIYFKKYLLTD